jgi:cob(I)alamin adenosyltransferase
MKIYTRTGDDGTTSLSGGKRVRKYHPRIEAYGSVDELISWIGLLRDCGENESQKDLLIFIQNQLMAFAATIASDPKDKKISKHQPDNESVRKLEIEIDKMEKKIKPLKSFIIPGGNTTVSYCHIARCVCRRTERAVVRLNQIEESPEIIHKFLNRLSDYLFVLSRKISLDLDIEEVIWSI